MAVDLGNNENRNMNEVVDFHNASNFPLDMQYAGESYGVVDAGETVKAPRMVAEFWAKKNIHFHVLEVSPWNEAIEGKKREVGSVEDVYSIQAKQEMEALIAAKTAKKLKKLAEAEVASEVEEAQEEAAEEVAAETVSVEEPTPEPEVSEEPKVDEKPKKK